MATQQRNRVAEFVFHLFSGIVPLQTITTAGSTAGVHLSPAVNPVTPGGSFGTSRQKKGSASVASTRSNNILIFSPIKFTLIIKKEYFNVGCRGK